MHLLVWLLFAGSVTWAYGKVVMVVVVVVVVMVMMGLGLGMMMMMVVLVGLRLIWGDLWIRFWWLQWR